MEPEDVPAEVVELYRAAYMDHSGEEGFLPIRYGLAAVLPEWDALKGYEPEGTRE